MKTWAIFSVYDYKGGELRSNCNLTYDRFINSLAEMFENVRIDLSEVRDIKIKRVLDEPTDTELNFLIDKLKKALNDEDFFSIYAGGDGFCGEIFEVEDGRMKEVNIEDYLEDVAKKIYNYRVRLKY
jgi:GTP cyclohydrolase III